MKTKVFTLGMAFLLLCSLADGAISTATFNDFQSGTTQDWVSGAVNPNPPSNVTTGGPTGTGDMYLQMESNGSGPGGSLVTFNTSTDWTGDWVAAGIAYVNMWVNNVSGPTLELRIAIDGTGGRFCTTVAQSVPAASGWVQISFPVTSADFSAVGGSNLNLTLSTVNTVRILHNPTASWTGLNSNHTIGIDAIDASDVTLPVTLLSFEAVHGKRGVSLLWESRDEVFNQKFVIERFVPGGHYQAIAEVAAQEGEGTKRYQWTDARPLQGLNRYRLKQVDLDGSFAFSEKVEVWIGEKNGYDIHLYPNPSGQQQLHLQFLGDPDAEAVRWQIADLQGRTIRQGESQLLQGKCLLDLSAQPMPAGNYLLLINYQGRREIRKLMFR